MSNKKDSFYFENFHECALSSAEAANCLLEILRDYDPETASVKARELHKVEHGADMKKHDLLSELVKSFITPIDRDEIIDLSQSIDNVVDAIEDVVINIDITGVRTIRDDVVPFAEVLVRCCDMLCELLEEFKQFKKSKHIKEIIVSINNLEEEGDACFLGAMKRLYLSDSAKEIIAWSEIYRALENACDACEDVADIVESIIIENV